MHQVGTAVQAIGVCWISWAETMAALARRQRDDPISSDDLDQARQHLFQSWQAFTIVEVSQPLVESAGRFAEVFAPRGLDSVQHAAAHQQQSKADQPVIDASYERRLNQAAQLLQMEVLP